MPPTLRVAIDRRSVTQGEGDIMVRGSRRVAGVGVVALAGALALGTLGPAAANPEGAAAERAVAVAVQKVSLRLASAPGQVADVSGQSQADEAEVIQWEFARSANQYWEPEATSDGFYRLKAVHSGKCLNVKGDSHEDEALIIQWPCGDAANEQWEFVPKGIGFQLVARSSGKCLNVSGGVGQGRNLIQYSCSAEGADNDVWLPVSE